MKVSQSMVACIGPITAKTAEELGLRVDVVASEYTVEGLVRAIKEQWMPRRSRRGGRSEQIQ